MHQLSSSPAIRWLRLYFSDAIRLSFLTTLPIEQCAARLSEFRYQEERYPYTLSKLRSLSQIDNDHYEFMVRSEVGGIPVMYLTGQFQRMDDNLTRVSGRAAFPYLYRIVTWSLLIGSIFPLYLFLLSPLHVFLILGLSGLAFILGERVSIFRKRERLVQLLFTTLKADNN